MAPESLTQAACLFVYIDLLTSRHKIPGQAHCEHNVNAKQALHFKLALMSSGNLPWLGNKHRVCIEGSTELWPYQG